MNPYRAVPAAVAGFFGGALIAGLMVQAYPTTQPYAEAWWLIAGLFVASALFTLSPQDEIARRK